MREDKITPEMRMKNHLCTKVRTRMRREVLWNMATGEEKEISSGLVTEPCHVPIFDDDGYRTGLCRGCRNGWTDPQNYPAELGPPRKVESERVSGSDFRLWLRKIGDSGYELLGVNSYAEAKTAVLSRYPEATLEGIRPNGHMTIEATLVEGTEKRASIEWRPKPRGDHEPRTHMLVRLNAPGELYGMDPGEGYGLPLRLPQPTMDALAKLAAAKPEAKDFIVHIRWRGQGQKERRFLVPEYLT